MQHFSVLMSVYCKEKPEYLCEAFDSIFRQTVLPTEVVVVKDGPLTKELEDAISKYTKKYDIIKIVALPENRGLGLALAEGVKNCTYELIARMDTDDVAKEDRFEKLLIQFEKDPKLDVCGSYMLEFEDSINNIVTRRRVPLTDIEIKKYHRRRDGLNHVTVMFKKSSVLSAGNYQHCPLMEDTLLWVNMFKNGAKAKNIDDYLMYVRIGKDMFERRGGWSYFIKYKNARTQIYKTGYISTWDYYYTLLVQLFVALIPNKMRGFVFKKILHN